jgi:glycosyltransferase involved in cell wall biosynthesis
VSFLKQITPVLLTYNEAPNLARTLAKLDWAEEVLIIDSFSDDETVAIARTRPQTRILQRRFDSFANQCSYGVEHAHTEWVLSMDADYVVSDELVEEIEALNPDEKTAGFSVSFKYLIGGKSLRTSLYPARTVLFRKDRVCYREEGHCQRLIVDGETRPLSQVIYHDDRKPLERWFAEQVKYAAREADYLETTPKQDLNRPDKIRRWIFAAPLLVLFYALFFRGLILDGWRGWFYAFQRMLAELVLSLKLLERKFSRNPK